MSSFEVLLLAMLDDAQAALGSLGVLDAQACDGLQRANALAAGGCAAAGACHRPSGRPAP
jgi:hypothetical protein